jgi:two-component system, OmpR family, sensor histidine kinase KdpD
MIDSQNLPDHTSPSVNSKLQRRGKHKVFIGMAPGVGKTYRMLDEAHQLKQEGIDVVIGLLETHGREETAHKAIGLEVIPRKSDRDGYRCDYHPSSSNCSGR